MPPYKPFVSQAQQEKLNAMADRGEISKKEVAGKNRATEGKKLPHRKAGSVRVKPHHFS